MVIEIEPHADERGLFARTWCRKEFAEAGLPSDFSQCSLSRNTSMGTLRGMHFQLPPSQEGKLVRCSSGDVFDVVVDLRVGSRSFLAQEHVRLSKDSARAIFIPPGCAHGFQTLVGDCDVVYQMTDYYAPELGSGIRWNDPILDIPWPLPVEIINDRDRGYPDLDESWLRSLVWD